MAGVAACRPGPARRPRGGLPRPRGDGLAHANSTAAARSTAASAGTPPPPAAARRVPPPPQLPTLPRDAELDRRWDRPGSVARDRATDATDAWYPAEVTEAAELPGRLPPPWVAPRLGDTRRARCSAGVRAIQDCEGELAPPPMTPADPGDEGRLGTGSGGMPSALPVTASLTRPRAARVAGLAGNASPGPGPGASKAARGDAARAWSPWGAMGLRLRDRGRGGVASAPPSPPRCPRRAGGAAAPAAGSDGAGPWGSPGGSGTGMSKGKGSGDSVALPGGVAGDCGTPPAPASVGTGGWGGCAAVPAIVAVGWDVLLPCCAR